MRASERHASLPLGHGVPINFYLCARRTTSARYTGAQSRPAPAAISRVPRPAPAGAIGYGHRCRALPKKQTLRLRLFISGRILAMGIPKQTTVYSAGVPVRDKISLRISD
ncbi:hypothetical protein EVAR_61194_1 [Eumeta japonica]|uniref:Uncharacterized protein n=1 Tax=Eumeta variegata TaxID=151549 RepID=A0A4C1YXI0_EUMVA|nr:hypothetical protein EVAR_61194_1 [Eumeta japonica]